MNMTRLARCQATVRMLLQCSHAIKVISTVPSVCGAAAAAAAAAAFALLARNELQQAL